MAANRIDCLGHGVADCTSYTAASLVTNVEGSEVDLVLVLTDSHIAVEPKADTTNHNAKRDVEWDAKRDVKLK